MNMLFISKKLKNRHANSEYLKQIYFIADFCLYWRTVTSLTTRANMDRFLVHALLTPVAGSFGLLSHTHFSESELKNEIFQMCFTWYPIDIPLCLWSGFIYPRIRTFDEKKISRSLFQKEPFEIRFMDSDSWNEAEVNFFRREKFVDEITWITWKTCLFVWVSKTHPITGLKRITNIRLAT